MAITLKLIGNDWSESIHAAAILAHIGEFGFILLAVGLDSGIIDTDANTLISSVIILTLLIGPLWMTVVKKVMFIDAKYIAKLRSNFANHVGAHLHLYKEQITKK
jgi:Kef-type K+ transport system membrane component KefB